jgi:hypothetical protein
VYALLDCRGVGIWLTAVSSLDCRGRGGNMAWFIFLLLWWSNLFPHSFYGEIYFLSFLMASGIWKCVELCSTLECCSPFD